MHCWFCCSNPVDSSLSECRTRLSTDNSTLHQVAHARPLSIRAATLCAPLLLAHFSSSHSLSSLHFSVLTIPLTVCTCVYGSPFSPN